MLTALSATLVFMKETERRAAREEEESSKHTSLPIWHTVDYGVCVSDPYRPEYSIHTGPVSHMSSIWIRLTIYSI